MKEARLNVRLSAKRLEKLKKFAELKDKTITQVIEEWIDRLRVDQEDA